ncbi:MAG: endonuclease/exonuclease/phosphatase family protein [Acidobacteriaceae bacterium]|nr:endonuclease/exonuclease/phosphatase family protein [Acidobacteriaceae bacterium]
MRRRRVLVLVSAATLLGAFAFEVQPRSAAPVPLGAAFSEPREINSEPVLTNINTARVISWNIDRGTEFETISAELQKNPADLCLLQEVDSNTTRAHNIDVAAELSKRLHMNVSFGIEFEELSQEHGQPAYIGQATLTRLPIRHSRILRFQHQSGFWQPHRWIPSSMPLLQRRLGNRMALITELEFCRRPLVVYNAHLESRSYGRIQSEQLDEITADLNRYPAGTAIIIGGDLNTKYLPSVFLHKLEHEGFQSATGERIERTHKVAMTLDWIFARGAIKVEEGAVRKDFRGSDHYPLYAEIVAAR